MFIKFYGHNCYLISVNNSCLLIDPWFSKNGAFLGSWQQWPQNHQFINSVFNELKKFEKVYLYISHEHEDHFCLESINYLKESISKCIIPKYFDDFLKNQINETGIECVELGDLEKFIIDKELSIELMIVDNGITHDSAIIIENDSKIFFNQNDCKIFDRLQNLCDRKVDFYAVQFSGATWHPSNYKYEQKKIIDISRKKIISKISAIKKAIKLIKPKYLFPSAGPAVFPFLDKKLSLGENDNIFIHQNKIPVLLNNVDTNIVYLRPGDTFEKNKKTHPILPPKLNQINEIKNSSVCFYEILKDEEINLQSLIEAISKRLNELKGLVFEECPLIYFNWGQGNFEGLEIDLNTLKVELTSKIRRPTNFYEIQSEFKYFNIMGNTSYRWSNIFLSLRARIDRNPDIFNNFINIFLNSEISNINKAFRTQLDIKETRIQKTNPITGQTYEIQRYCPHNGADLIDAEIDSNGNLVCPRHHWKFDLNNDGICKNSNMSINAELIKNKITLCENVSINLTSTITDKNFRN